MSDATAAVAEVLARHRGYLSLAHLGPRTRAEITDEAAAVLAAVSAAPEFVCPACGAVTRARMADAAAEPPIKAEGTETP
jgi:hypothetical protein